MHSFLFAFGWGILVLVSMAGWGWLLAKLLLPRYKLDFGLYAANGLVLSCLFGGVLNYANAISPKTVIVYLLVGLLPAIVYLIIELRPWVLVRDFFKSLHGNKLLAALFALTALVVIFQYALSVSPGVFNTADDYQAYLVFPQQMLQTGSFGNNPFSERRMLTSLGGQPFLDILVLAKLPIKNLRLLDEGICYLIFLAIIWGLFREFKISYAMRLVLLFAVLFSPVPTDNTTILFGVSALFLGLFRLARGLGDNQSFGWQRAAIIGLWVGAICCLKSNFIPVAALFAAGFYALMFWKQKFSKAIILEALLAGAVAMLLMLPWMISMLRSSGTLLYPFLGKGFYGATYGGFAAANSELFTLNGLERVIFNLRELLVPCTVFLAFCFFAAKARLKQQFGLVAVLVAAAAIGAAGIIYATGSADTYRYIYAFTIAVFIVLLAEAFNPDNATYSFNKIGVQYWVVALVIAAVYFGGGAGKFLETTNLTGAADKLKFAVTNADITSPAEQLSYKSMQGSVPAGQTIFARTDKNFLLDFKRNSIYIDDSPGGSSPPPGMPFFKGSEPVANFLLSKNIRYVAYSYADQAGFTRGLFGDRLSPAIQVWIRTEAVHYFDFQDNLATLGQSRKRIYDDGSIFVLDLTQRAQ
jgi:hypothetical protein